MVDLSDAVLVLAPAVDFLETCRIVSGVIVHWDADALGRPQPTPEELAAVTEEQVAAAKTARLREQAIAAGAEAAPLSRGVKGGFAVTLRGFNADRDVMRAIIDALLGYLSGALTVSQAIAALQAIRAQVPPAMTMPDAEALRQQAIANGEAD